MPRYVVERTFPDGVRIPTGRDGAELCLRVVEHSAEEGVTWGQAFVTEDKTRAFCIYDAPSAEAIRKAATREDLPRRPHYVRPHVQPPEDPSTAEIRTSKTPQ